MDRFFGPSATAVANPFAKKELKPAGEGLGEGVRAIKVPLEDLMKSYVVSYAGLLGDHGNGDKQMSKESSDEASCSEPDDEEEPEPAGEPEEEDIDKEEKGEKDEGKKKKKAKKRVVKRDRVGDYDLDDPFIDDDEVAVAYESIFDLLHGAPDDEMMDADVPERRRDVDDDKPPLREFYVYRGEMQVEVVSKLKGKKKKKETSGDNVSNGDAVDEAPKRSKKSKKSADSQAGEAKVKKVKEKKEKPVKKEASLKEKPMSTLERILNLEAKLDVPIAPPKQPSLEESAKGTPEKAKRNVVDYDRLYAELETRLSLEAWKAQAQAIESFEPSKFPSILRDPTGNLAISYLRAAAPNHSDIEESLFEELAKIVPYTPIALRKVTFKKILPLFLQEIQKKLEAMYVAFTNECQQLAVPSNSQPEQSQEDPTASQLNNPANPTKSRLKFNEITRQLIYEIVRFELDAAYIEQSLRVFEPSDPDAAPSKLPGEMLLRKSIYQKIFKALPASLCQFTTTHDISLQYGQQKRKIERKLLKDHGVEPQGEVIGEKRKAPQPSALSLNEPVAAAEAPLESAPKRLDPEPAPDQRNLFAEMLFSTENVPQN